MLIKIEDTYLDLTKETDILLEQQVKLFEEFSDADGDVSFAFDLPDTNNNKATLGITGFNVADKLIYQGIECSLTNDSGHPLHRGILKVENYEGHLITCSFFSGNSNWIEAIEGDVKDLDFSEYNIEPTRTNVEASWSLTSGIVFPLIDKGKLSERISPVLVQDSRLGDNLYLNKDFQPFIFCKDIFRKIFAAASLKITGALLNDWLYNNLIVTNNAGNAGEALEARSSYVGKTVQQSISSGSYVKVTWIDDADPYEDGDNDNFDNGNDRWVADVDCFVKTTVSITYEIPGFPGASTRIAVAIYKNGANYSENDYFLNEGEFTISTLELDAGDYIEVFIKPFTTNINVNVGSYFRITPTKIKEIFAVDVVPDFSKRDFVKNIFKIFNVVPTYDPYSKTVNLELFKNIANKEPQDLTAYIDPTSIKLDYFDFINRYGKKNTLSYSESSVEEVEEYNNTNTVAFGSGSINLNNQYLQGEVSLGELDFTAPFQQQNEVFQMSLLKLNYLGDEETGEHALAAVLDNAGVAQFVFSGTPSFSRSVGDLIRIKETSTGTYVGTGIISALGTVGPNSYFELVDVEYQNDCTGTFCKINYTENSNADPVLAVFVPITSLSNLSPIVTSLSVNTISESSIAYAYFFKHYQGGIGVDTMSQGLSFGEITGQGFYQNTLIDTYYRNMETLLNDPVKVMADFKLPQGVFTALDFTRPVRLNTEKARGLFYLNKIFGYKESWLPCEIELIKLR